jgi:hypothetical protein
LDLTGRLPESPAARAFLRGTNGSRKEVVERLLRSPEFADFWTMHFADLLLLNGKGEGTAAFYGWLRAQVATNAPIDQMASALLTAHGELASVGPANFYAVANDPRDLSEHVCRIFLGAQIACARCHAHPADRWTQDDYLGMAAYFARLSRGNGVLAVSARGEIDHPKSGRPVAPRALGARAPQTEPSGSEDRRTSLAGWICSSANPSFARSLVNRVWAHLLGQGLVEPVDDLRPTNPASHPALLDALAADFAGHAFDLRHLIRTIVNSRTYQLSSDVAGPANLDPHSRLCSHAALKELPAQVFADAIAQVTGVGDVYANQPEGTRAVQLMSPATPSAALDVLGRCPRARACDGASRSGGGLARALHLINGPSINDKLAPAARTLLAGRSNDAVIEELYLRALTRRPTDAEQAAWTTRLERATDRQLAVEDLLWTILNSREFAFNH